MLDFKYRRLTDFSYAFYIGEIYIGQVFKMKNYWSAVPRVPIPNIPGPFDGFKNRYYACEFMLKIQGYTNRDVNLSC